MTGPIEYEVDTRKSPGIVFVTRATRGIPRQLGAVVAFDLAGQVIGTYGEADEVVATIEYARSIRWREQGV